MWIPTIVAALALLTATLVALKLIADRTTRHLPSRPVAWAGRVFPEGFVWFTGEDAYQHEGGNRNNDWAAMEASVQSPVPHGERNEMAADFFRRYEEDFDRITRAGHQAHRLGVEWSRIEPERGRYDEAALAVYGRMLESLRGRGVKIFLNVWHFTLPLWASDLGGWENDEVMDEWRRLVRTLARRFGRVVDFWSTMIDAQIYALRGYLVGDIPPRVHERNRAMRVYATLVRTHAEAYHIIKEETDDAPVGQIYFFDWYEPKGSFPDTLVCRGLDRVFNTAYLDALWTGRLDIDAPGAPRVREHHPRAQGTLDWLGVNYYRRQIVGFDPKADGMVRQETRPDAPTTDMGWEIYPEGIYLLLKRLAARYPGLPLYIAENGLADAADTRRPRFILDHLAWVHEAIAAGVPVRGYAYWSLTDNWEWTEGYGPKFGLYEVDRETGARRERPSARLYRWIVRRNALPHADALERILHANPEEPP